MSSLGQGQSHQVSDYKWPAPDCLAEKTVFASRFLPAGDYKVCPLASYMFDKSDEEHWYALKVFYNRVFDVERLLAQDGVKTYIPLRSTETTVGGRTIRRREPAVSSLMFVRQAERAVLELMQRAKATSPLMVYFDRETKKPAVIPDPEMEAFMLVTSTDDPGLEYLPEAPAELRRGDRVRVTECFQRGRRLYSACQGQPAADRLDRGRRSRGDDLHSRLFSGENHDGLNRLTRLGLPEIRDLSFPVLFAGRISIVFIFASL